MTASPVVEDVAQYLLTDDIDFSGRLKLTYVAKPVLFIRRDDAQSVRSILVDVKVFLGDVDVLDRAPKVSAIDMEPILLPLVLNRFVGSNLGPDGFDTIIARTWKKRLATTHRRCTKRQKVGRLVWSPALTASNPQTPASTLRTRATTDGCSGSARERLGVIVERTSLFERLRQLNGLTKPELKIAVVDAQDACGQTQNELNAAQVPVAFRASH